LLKSGKNKEQLLEILGPVTIGTMQVVKLVTKVAIAATAVACVATGLNILTSGALGGSLAETTGTDFGLSRLGGATVSDAIAPLLGFLGACGVWEVADWIQGKLEVNHTKNAQERELARLERVHGQPLSRI
tara:strand:- start:3324 stop:3716 length:393 start_codon:yes stop_codon:yes gene_type:complete